MSRKKVKFTNSSGHQLAAIIELPDAGEPLGFAVFAHCFTCSKNLNAVRNIAKALTNNGIAVLLFDFTGLGESEGDFENTNFSSNIEDLLDAANFLKKEYKTVSISFVKNIKKYQTDFNTFYWIDEENNWYTCDLFGKIIFKEKIPPFDSIEIININKYLYNKDNILIYNDTKKGLKFEIDIPEKTFKKFSYKDQILSIFTSKGITNYKITIP